MLCCKSSDLVCVYVCVSVYMSVRACMLMCVPTALRLDTSELCVCTCTHLRVRFLFPVLTQFLIAYVFE